MTTPTTDNQAQIEQKNDKEINFAQMRQKYEKELASKTAQIEEMQRQMQAKTIQDDDDDDSDPYIDKKRLRKEQAKLTQAIKQETQAEIDRRVAIAINQGQRDQWLKGNPDFENVIKQHADKIQEKDPELAETILSMPEGFERLKLVYKTIKTMGLDKPAAKEPTIQDKINANLRSPYYQPSQMGTAPYSNGGDFSTQGKKQAYDKMKELQSRLRG